LDRNSYTVSYSNHRLAGGMARWWLSRCNAVSI